MLLFLAGESIGGAVGVWTFSEKGCTERPDKKQTQPVIIQYLSLQLSLYIYVYANVICCG